MTLWTVARQAPLSMGILQQEHWSGLPCPPPGHLPNPRIEPRSPTLHTDSLLSKCVYLVVSKIAHLEKEMATHSSTLAWKIPLLCLCYPLGAHDRLVEPYLLYASWWGYVTWPMACEGKLHVPISGANFKNHCSITVLPFQCCRADERIYLNEAC